MSVKSAVAPLAIEAIVHVTVPLAPKDGVVQANAGPLFCTMDTKVIVPGIGSLRLTVVAAAGPLLMTWMV